MGDINKATDGMKMLRDYANTKFATEINKNTYTCETELGFNIYLINFHSIFFTDLHKKMANMPDSNLLPVYSTKKKDIAYKGYGNSPYLIRTSMACSLLNGQVIANHVIPQSEFIVFDKPFAKEMITPYNNCDVCTKYSPAFIP